MNKKARRVVHHSEDLQWKPPNYGLYKINFDGALFDDQASAGLGWSLEIGRGRSLLH